MNTSEARELVKKFPKRIGTFCRERFYNVKEATKVNFMIYKSGDIVGCSIGDGRVRNMRLERVEGGGKVLVPDRNILS